jgi:murein DD-endopeptidase MepM/ murein hydrolase activator NlpD
MTAYSHMDAISIKRGDTVKRGQAIGTVGMTGSVDSPQLHFEIRRGVQALNPEAYLDGRKS